MLEHIFKGLNTFLTISNVSILMILLDKSVLTPFASLIFVHHIAHEVGNALIHRDVLGKGKRTWPKEHTFDPSFCQLAQIDKNDHIA